MRARKKKWADNEININELLVENPGRCKGAWAGYFLNARPVHAEIGCGKGRFIVETAAAEPDINFIALEREKQVIISGLRRAREAELKNLAFILADADCLPDIFGPDEIKRLYINFCDPWPNRKKWAKRRLTHENYLKMYETFLDGPLYLKTDNRELFEFSLSQFEIRNWDVKNILWDLHSGGYAGLTTEYEDKFAAAGIPIMRCEATPKNL